MTYNELYRALRTLAVETESFPCLGCEHSNNCRLSGCAILRTAAEAIRHLRHQNEALTAALKAAEEK